MKDFVVAGAGRGRVEVECLDSGSPVLRLVLLTLR